MSLAASVRHGACSIAEVAKERISSPAGRAMMAFIWIALVYVIVAFADITAGSFVSAVDEIKGIKVNFNPGGAVASASVFYLLLSIVMGITQRLFKPPLWLLTAIFVPATFVVVWMGTWFSELFAFDAKTWVLIICGYCFFASLCPVWLLLQPRGYLGGFVLYSALAVGLIGVFFGGYTIQQPAFKGWDVGGLTGALFPFLFVTIACGACSGFHGLVCSGTTSKQIDKESDMHAIGYGAMLAEGLVAVLALSIVMVMSADDVRGLKPGTIYGNGLGEFLTLIIGKEHLPFAITFGAMAFSTFVFDTIDVATRLGRYLIQELTGLRTLLGRRSRHWSRSAHRHLSFPWRVKALGLSFGLYSGLRISCSQPLHFCPLPCGSNKVASASPSLWSRWFSSWSLRCGRWSASVTPAISRRRALTLRCSTAFSRPP